MAIARIFCTRVRATVVFPKAILKKRFSCEHVCKISRLKGRIMTLSRVLQCFLKVLQNRSEKLKNAFQRAIISILLGFLSDFRSTHTILIINMQTFGGLIFEAHFARQKQCLKKHHAQDCSHSGSRAVLAFSPQFCSNNRFPNRRVLRTPTLSGQINPILTHSEVRTPYRYRDVRGMMI